MGVYYPSRRIRRRIPVPLQHDVKSIRARYGTGVASYFVFCQWVFINFSVVMITFGAFTIVHLVTLANTGYPVSLK